MTLRSSRSGGAAGTALGLLILGFSSAVFGAMVLGPTLGKAAHARNPAPPGELRPLPEPPTPAREPAAVEEEAPQVSVRPDPFSHPDGEASVLPDETLASAEPPLPPLRPAEPEEPRPAATASPRSGPEPAGTAAPRRPAAPTSDLAKRLTPSREAAPKRTERSEVPRPAPEAPAPTAAGGPGPEAPRETTRPKPRPEPPLRPAAETAPAPAPAEAAAGGLYRVRVGTYRTQAEAEEARRQVNRTPGAAATVHRVGDTYRVQVGAFRRKENADRIAEQLRRQNLPVEVTTPAAPAEAPPAKPDE